MKFLSGTLMFVFLSTVIMMLAPLSQASDDNSAKFERLRVEGGWPDTYVYAALQDNRGFLWFGTRNGLSKYDGIEITTYAHDSDNPNSLSNNYVWSLFQERTGTLWIGTWGSGLDQFDPVYEKFIHYRHDPNNPHSLSSDLISKVYKDSSGVLWVSTELGLNQLDHDNQNFIRYQHDPDDPHSLSSNNLSAVLEDKAGNLWISTYDQGLNRFDRATKTFTRYLHDDNIPNSLSNNVIWTLYNDSQGNLWIGTEEGLEQFDSINNNFIHHRHDENNPNSLSHNTVLSIYEDKQGVLWVGTYGGGLNRFDREHNQFTRYQSDIRQLNGLSNNEVWTIIEDANGALWVCTTNGVNKYDPNSHRFAHFQYNPKDDNSLNENQVAAIFQDKNRILWLGTTGGGLNKFDPTDNTFTHYQRKENETNSLIHNTVNAILPGSEGILWLGTADGLDKFDTKNNTFVHYQNDPKNENTLASNSVLALTMSRSGFLWIGQDGSGVDKFDPVQETFTHYVHDENDLNSLASNWVMAVYVDSVDTLWIGFDGGLGRLDSNSETFVNYYPSATESNSLSSTTVNVIYEDHAGTIWVGTNDGLNKLDRNTHHFTIYRSKNGLASNSVSSIIEDQQGYLWVSTSKGLSKFDPRAETFRNYDQWDGLQSNLFLLKSSYLSDTGEVFFGGEYGFNAFYPDKLIDNPYIPPVVLTDFQIFNKSVQVGKNSPLTQHISTAKQITLSHDQSVFSFKFAALNYRASTKNQYAYLMEGVDKDWVHVSSQQRFATYTRLSPGKYTFRVKASNNDGIWNEQGTSIQVIILTPWWQTWGAYSLYTIIILGSIISIFTISLQTSKENERRLRQFLDAMPVGVAVLESTGNVHFFNRTAKKLLRKDEQDTPTNEICSTYQFYVGGSSQPYPTDQLTSVRALRGEYSIINDIEIHLADKIIPLENTGTPIFDKMGKVIYGLVTFQDISERKQAEENRIRLIQEEEAKNSALRYGHEIEAKNTELLKLNQEKNEFLGIVAHDLKNPLSAILGLAELIQDEIDNLSKAEIVEYSGDIALSSKQMFDLIVNLLDVNAIESGKIRTNLEQINILPIVQRLVQAYHDRAKAKNIAIHLEVSENGYFAFVDKEVTLQIFDNLISNAIKYSPHNKKVTVKLSTLEKEIRCKIKDEGFGLSQTDQQKLFGKFTRLSTKPTGGEHSTGLGLFIVKKLVTTMNGEVWCESELGKGATFIVTFPVL